MKELRIKANLEELDSLIKETNEVLASIPFSNHDKVLINTALEEVFVNVVKYAMKCNGEFTYIVDSKDDKAIFTFIDTGEKFNPLEMEDPDVTLCGEKRSIGGLGIYMVKQSMDECSYTRSNNQNHFVMKRKIK